MYKSVFASVNSFAKKRAKAELQRGRVLNTVRDGNTDLLEQVKCAKAEPTCSCLLVCKPRTHPESTEEENLVVLASKLFAELLQHFLAGVEAGPLRSFDVAPNRRIGSAVVRISPAGEKLDP